MDSAFTYSPGTVADYCFTYSIYDDPPGANPAYFHFLTPSQVSPTPTRISGVTSVLFNYAAGMLPSSPYTGDLAYKVMAKSILTTGTSVLAPISVKFYHECYYATITAPSDQTATYLVGDASASLIYALFTTDPVGCAITYSLSVPSALFSFSDNPSDKIVTMGISTDNNLANNSPIVLNILGELQYGTAQAMAKATFNVVKNPCLDVIIPEPPTTLVTYDIILSSSSASITIDHATLLPVNY